MPYIKEENILRLHEYYHTMRHRLSKIYARLFPEKHNMAYFAFSLIMAIFLWHSINGGEKVQENYDVRMVIDYRNLPEGLTIRERTDTVFLRIRGTAEDFKELDRRELIYSLDLSDIERGANMLALEADTLANLDKFQIISTNPSHVLIVTENYAEKAVPLEAIASRRQTENPYTLSEVKISPSYVTIRGGESLINSIDMLNVPLNIAKEEKAGVHSQSVAVQIRAGIEAEPPIVEVHYRLEPQMQEITLEKDIYLLSYSKNGFKVSNKKAMIKFFCPIGSVGDKTLYDKIVIYREPFAIAGDSSRLHAVLPIECRLIEIIEK